MTTGNFSQSKGIFKVPGKEGDVFTVNLPDGSPRYILLQEVDSLVELLQENYQGGKEPVNPIEELDGLISILKQNPDWVYTSQSAAPEGISTSTGPKGGERWDANAARAKGTDVEAHLASATPSTEIQVGISSATKEGQRATEYFGEQARVEKKRADDLIRPPQLASDGTQVVDKNGSLVYLEPTTEQANEAHQIYRQLAESGTQRLQQALDGAGFSGFTVASNFGLFDSAYEPSTFIHGTINEEDRDDFIKLMVDIADNDFDQRSVIVHEIHDENNPSFGVVSDGIGEVIEPSMTLTFNKSLDAKDFNNLGKILNDISESSIGFASHPDGKGMDILNLSVYNTDYTDFIGKVEEFIRNNETIRIAGEMGQSGIKARKGWIFGKKSGPAGYYSKGHYETLDEYDGLATYEDYRSYYDASKTKQIEKYDEVAPTKTIELPTSKLYEGPRPAGGEISVVTSEGNPPEYLYRVMSRSQYDNALETGTLKGSPDFSGRIFASGIPSVARGWGPPLEPQVLVAIKYSDVDEWEAKLTLDETVAISERPIPASRMSLITEGSNKAELLQNWKAMDEVPRITPPTARAAEAVEEAVKKSLDDFIPYTASTFAKRVAVEDLDELIDVLKQDDNTEDVSEETSLNKPNEQIVSSQKPFTSTDAPSSTENAERREESHEEVPPVQDSTPTPPKYDFTALETKRPINSRDDIIQLWEVNEGARSPVASTYAGDWTILREVQRRDYSEEPQLCMQAAHMAARANNGKFVQGTVMGAKGKRIVHAWAEIGDFVYDPVTATGVIATKKDYYKNNKAKDLVRLSSQEAEELHYKYDPKGLWGPYDKEEIEEVRERDSILTKQVLEPNPQQPLAGFAAPPSPDDIVYVSQNNPPSGDVPKHTGTRGGEYWLRSQALSIMDWNEDQLNEYLNTEQEEIQSESLEDLQAQRPEVVADVQTLRKEKNRKYRIYQSAKRAMDRGEVEESEVNTKRNAYKAAKDTWEEGRVKLDLLNEKIEGLTSDALEMPSEESTSDIEPELDTTIDNLKVLLEQDPEASKENKADIFAILEDWSEQERQVRADITNDDEYFANSTVQSAIEAVSTVAETTNWRNLETLSEIPLVSDMILEGQLDSRIGILSTRLDAYKDIGGSVLEHFEETYTLPSFNLDGTPASSTEGDWRQAPMNEKTLKKLLQSKSNLMLDYAWFSKAQLNQRITLSQMSKKSTREYNRDLKDAKNYDLPAPNKQDYLIDAEKEEVTLTDLLFNMNKIYYADKKNKATGATKSVSFTTISNVDIEESRVFDISHDKLQELQQLVLNEVSDSFGPPAVSTDFRKKFKNIAESHSETPSTDTDHIVSELYRATKFDKFHAESSSAMEKSTNSLLGGLIKAVIGSLTNSKILHHGSKQLVDRNGNLVALEEGYKKYPKNHVAEYVKVHKKLTRQLLDYMYPNSDGIELYRGTVDAKLKAFAEPAIQERKNKFFNRLLNRKVQGVKIMVDHNPVTQYSSKPAVAYDFATDLRTTRPDEVDSDKPATDAAQGQGGLVLIQQVPKDSIWSSFGTGHTGTFRKGTEKEFYVAHTGKPVVATAYLPGDFYDYIRKQGVSFNKQNEQLLQDDKEDKDLILVIDDEINSDWIQAVNELWEEKPELGTKSKMPPIKIDPVEEMDEVSMVGQRTGMPKIPVEPLEIVETTPTVQKSIIYKQQELGQTLAQADPARATTPTEEAAIHPAAQGKVRTVIFELVHRAGRTFERRRTAWVNPKVAEAINSRQKASDWIRLLGNYLPLYFVGGFVRDKLMGKVSKDVDIIALVPLDEVQKTFDSLNIEYKKVSAKDKKILTLQVAGMEVDVASAEAEDLPKDLMKRDFTINAVAQSVTGQFYDPSNGLQDIKNKILRSPRNQSSKRFEEDPVRIMRAARFMGNYKLKAHSSVIKGIKKHGDKLKDMPKARIGRELAKIMQSDKPATALEFMAEYNLLEAIDPAVAKMVDYKQNTPHHKWNLWKHTMSSLKKAESEDMILNLAIFLHDIGKPDASDADQSTFHGHEKHSAKHAASILKRLEFSEDHVKRVENLVAMHMRLLTVPENSSSGAFRRIKIQAGADLNRLIALAKADIHGSGVEIEDKLKQLDVIIAKIKNIEDVPDKKNFSPLTGKEIIDSLGISQGPQVGDIKEHLHNLVIDEDLEATDKKGAVKEARKYMDTITKEIDDLMVLLNNA